MSDSAVSVNHLGKCFRFYPKKRDKILGALFQSWAQAKEFWALRNLTFSLPRGASLAVIGANGAGKTSLLQLLAGLLKPTEGTVEVNGNLATLLEMGGGFQLELTGRENIVISSGLRGFSKREITERLEEIISFSELAEFIDHPVRHYSSGMQMRLAFATAIIIEPEVLLIDEVFAVGDMAFQHKCVRKFRQLQNQGTTIVLVTHDMTAAKSLCSSALLLDSGQSVKFGNPEEVTNIYLDMVAQKIAKQAQQNFPVLPAQFSAKMELSDKAHRHGTGEGIVCSVEILPGESISFGEEGIFKFNLEYLADVAESGLGFFIRDRYGNDILGINTFEEGKPLGSRRKGDRLEVEFRLPLYLRPGTYSVSPGFSYHRDEPRYLDWIDNAAFFMMEKPVGGQQVHGLVYFPNQVSVRMVTGG